MAIVTFYIPFSRTQYLLLEAGSAFITYVTLVEIAVTTPATER